MAHDDSDRIVLDADGWALAEAEPGSGPEALPGLGWLPAAVPGTVAATLVGLGRVPDPYVDMNVRALRWIEDRDWWYRLRFSAPALPAGSRLRLVCHGLTAIAEAWLDEVPLGRSANMWLPFTADLTEHVRPGLNELRFRFPALAPLLATDGGWAGAMRRQPAAHLRTCQCVFGWDSVPRLPAVGLWRPVELVVERDVAFDDLAVAYTLELDRRRATVRLGLTARRLSPAASRIHVDWSIRRDGQAVARRRTTHDLDGAGTGELAAALELDRVELWWPVGHGAPALYEAVAEVGVGVAGRRPRRIGKPFGLRTVELLETPDDRGREFAFAINGRRIFARGANWTPPDLLTLDGPPERTERLLRLAVEAGMNMLRVWGGGIYPPESFYDRCDALGLLVWQDFMYACSAYPDHDPEFVANARREAEWAVTSLRHHPSVVCWCGNNENEWIFSRLPPERRGPGEVPGARLFADVLPEVCARLDGTRPYRRSTPYGGSVPNSPDEGTQHFYTVGLGVDDEGRFDFRWSTFGPHGYARRPGRFIAEFGAYVGLPEPAAVEAFLSKAERSLDSESWRGHLPVIGHWPVTFQHILDFQLSQLFGVMPAALGWVDYQAYARLVQGEALRLAFEAFRRNKPETSGALMWSLNGVWPAADWALVDHRSVPKPGYWFAMRALAPTLLSLEADLRGVAAWAVHDGPAPLDALIRLEYGNVRTGQLWRGEHAVRVDPAAACHVARHAWSDLPGVDPDEAYVAGSLWADGTCLSRAAVLPLSLRSARLPEARLRAQLVGQDRTRASIRVRTDVFAYAVRLSCDGAGFADNYFHLAAGEEREIELDLAGARTQECAVEALNAPEAVRVGVLLA